MSVSARLLRGELSGSVLTHLYNAMQCSAVQCSAVQCSAVQCSAVQCSAMQCNAIMLLSIEIQAVFGCFFVRAGLFTQ